MRMKSIATLSGLLLVLVVTCLEARPIAFDSENITDTEASSVIVDSTNIPNQCKDSFNHLKHVREQRGIAKDFPSLKYIAKSAELDFLDCINKRPEQEHDVTKEMANEPDAVVWAESN